MTLSVIRGIQSYLHENIRAITSADMAREVLQRFNIAVIDVHVEDCDDDYGVPYVCILSDRMRITVYEGLALEFCDSEGNLIDAVY